MSLILPSFELIPGKFNVGSLFAQIPMDGSADLTVTRGSDATRFNASGNIQVMGSGIPRLDYYTSGGVTGCPALLVEPAATNLVFHSEQFTAGNYYLLRQATTTNNVTGTLDPAGGNTADQIFPDNSTNLHQILSNDAPNNITFVSGTTYTQSVFAKAGNGSQGQRMQSTFSSSRFTGLPFANFNLASGTVTTTGGGATASIQSMGNGWYRCITTAVCNNSGSGGGFFAGLITTDNAVREESFLGIDTHFIYAWGGQMETGSVATSYIPTTTGTVTRAADVISVSGAVSGSIGQTEGTFYFDFQASPSGASSNWLNISDGTTNNWLFIGKDSNKCRGYLKANNVVILTQETFVLTDSPIKVALAYKSGDYALYINGNLNASGTTAFAFSAALTRIHNGAGTPSASNEISRYRAVALYTTRLTNAQLEFLTSPYTSYSQMATTLSYTIL